jgi:hypothetical protein
MPRKLGSEGAIGPQIVPGTIVGTVTLSGGAGDVTDVVISAGTVMMSPAADGTSSMNIAPGTYTVTFELNSYETVTVNDVTVESGEEIQVDATLVYQPSGITGTVPLPAVLVTLRMCGVCRRPDHEPCRRRHLQSHP